MGTQVDFILNTVSNIQTERTQDKFHIEYSVRDPIKGYSNK